MRYQDIRGALLVLEEDTYLLVSVVMHAHHYDVLIGFTGVCKLSIHQKSSPIS